MKTVHISRAQRHSSFDESGTYTRILIGKEIPEQVDLKEARAVFTREAETLFNALVESLPGGTLSALFARMCEHYRSLFVVR